MQAAGLLFDPHEVYFESRYTNPRTGREKVTTVWPAEIRDDAQITVQPDEIIAYRFVPIEHASSVLSFREDRDTMAQLAPLLRAEPDPARYPKIILFGDSLTQFSHQAGGLAQRLADTYQRRLDVVNRGFSGYNSTWALQLLPHIFPVAQEDHGRPLELVAIWLGANDAAGPGSSQHVPVARYSDNLHQIVEHFRVATPRARLVFITPPPVLPPFRERSLTIQYVEAVRAIGAQLQVPVVDSFAAIEAAAGDAEGLRNYLSDGLYLLPAGYEVSACVCLMAEQASR